MDTTTIRQIAHIQAIGFLLAVLLTYPIMRKIQINLSRIPAAPMMSACVFGIVWFAGLYLSTGQESRVISRAALVPALTAAEFIAVNSAWLWYILLLKHSIRIEPIRAGETLRIVIRLVSGGKNGHAPH
jgi:hypothetical protein